MPPKAPKQPEPPDEPVKTIQQIADELGLFAPEAFVFVQEGLSYTVNKIHGQTPEPDVSRHVSGQQLCEGIRDYALAKWGLMARAVLARWGVNCTLDFGKIVFALIDARYMSRTETDMIEDFRNIFDFKTAFDSGYRIQSPPT